MYDNIVERILVEAGKDFGQSTILKLKKFLKVRDELKKNKHSGAVRGRYKVCFSDIAHTIQAMCSHYEKKIKDLEIKFYSQHKRFAQKCVNKDFEEKRQVCRYFLRKYA